MWIVAGVLLGVVVLAALIGFHSGPHAHVAAGVAGLVAGIWLVVMALSGRSSSVLWALLMADLVVSAGLGVTAWKGLSSAHAAPPASKPLEGLEGVAASDLTPEGLVRVKGEQWSAVSVNGTARAGTPVQVLRVAGVRLEVWSEDVEMTAIDPAVPAPELFRLREGGRGEEARSEEAAGNLEEAGNREEARSEEAAGNREETGNVEVAESEEEAL